jgi:hypothetical protein
MLTKRLFRFGYEHPTEAELNTRHGWEDESSAGLWIVSTSEAEAMTWGRAVAEQFVSSLFEATQQSEYSWKAAEFAHWIETEPIELLAAVHLPIVSVGTMPDFAVLSSKE